MNYQSGSASFTMTTQFKTDRSFSDYLLPSVDLFPLCFDAQTMQEQKLRIEENHLVVRPNIQNDPQQWY